MQRRMNRKGFLLIIGVMLAVFLTLHLILQSTLQEGQDRQKALQVSLTGLEEKNRELAAQLEVVGTEDYIVSSAMGNYAYMNKNDIRFEISNPEALYAYTEEELKILMDELAE